MRTATATYHAPKGDDKTVEMGGVSFNDGEAVELNSDQHGHLVNKLPGNKHFEIEVGEDDSPEPADDPLHGKKIAELRQMATDRGIDPEGKSKAELRDALSN